MKRIVTKYMTFQQVGNSATEWSVINNKSGFELGRVEWYSMWRQFIYTPTSCSIFNNTCLDDISQFLTKLNKGEL